MSDSVKAVPVFSGTVFIGKVPHGTRIVRYALPADLSGGPSRHLLCIAPDEQPFWFHIDGTKEPVECL